MVPSKHMKGSSSWMELNDSFSFFLPLRTQAEMAHTCRGTINLATAHIDTEDACNIVLSSGGRTYHLKASTEVERQRWVTALELAKAKAIRMMNDQSGKSILFPWGTAAKHSCSDFSLINMGLAGLEQTYLTGCNLDFWKVCRAPFTFPVLTDAAYSEPAEGSTVCPF